MPFRPPSPKSGGGGGSEHGVDRDWVGPNGPFTALLVRNVLALNIISGLNRSDELCRDRSQPFKCPALFVPRWVSSNVSPVELIENFPTPSSGLLRCNYSAWVCRSRRIRSSSDSTEGIIITRWDTWHRCQWDFFRSCARCPGAGLQNFTYEFVCSIWRTIFNHVYIHIWPYYDVRSVRSNVKIFSAYWRCNSVVFFMHL